MDISLCLAVYNEEKFIDYPLRSAYDLVDEVIIVDGGSRDKTVEIAKSYGKKVKVFIEDNPAMFHINKQKAIERAKGEWILQLDADEALSKELKEEIKRVIYQNESKTKLFPQVNSSARKADSDIHSRQNFVLAPVAYYIPRKNFFLTRFLEKGGQYPDYTLRLYRNGSARFPCRDVHENVEIIENSKLKTLKTKNGSLRIGYLKAPILHYADPDFSRYLNRWNRYTTLEAEKLFKEKKRIGFLNYFFIKPIGWFFKTYLRHRGFLDGFPGFIFALFSSLRFWVIYIKVWTKDYSN